jgi:hypothetical protein
MRPRELSLVAGKPNIIHAPSSIVLGVRRLVEKNPSPI